MGYNSLFSRLLGQRRRFPTGKDDNYVRLRFGAGGVQV
jgi:hypothetical protein